MVLNIPQCVSLLRDPLVVRQCVLGDSLQPGLPAVSLEGIMYLVTLKGYVSSRRQEKSLKEVFIISCIFTLEFLEILVRVYNKKVKWNKNT